LPALVDKLAAAGLKSVYVSIDSPDMSEHERNRGLKGLGERIRVANARMPALSMTPFAQVTMSKLIGDYRALVPMLRDYGFAAIAFSYPQQAKLGSTTMAWSDDSSLVRFTPEELVSAFDAVDELRSQFPVNNPSASIGDMKRHLRGEKEKFACYAGYKSFYMDWNYDVWRCDAWSEPMCSVWEFASAPFVRDGCTACIADCYRDSSVMLHFAVALGDAMDAVGEARLLQALKMLVTRNNLASIGAVAQNTRALARLARVG
jgi:MoaA/NifB/PqqE/SkfB family radical SAM enzyme